MEDPDPSFRLNVEATPVQPPPHDLLAEWRSFLAPDASRPTGGQSRQPPETHPRFSHGPTRLWVTGGESFGKVALQNLLEQPAVGVVEHQRETAFWLEKRNELGQRLLRLGEPLEHGMAGD